MLAVALLLVSAAAVVQGATHTVGDALGWGVPGTFNKSKTYLSDWAANQTFVAGDTVRKCSCSTFFPARMVHVA